MKDKMMQKNIKRAAYFLLGLLVVLLLYLTYLQIYQGNYLSQHSLNKRNNTYAANVERGTILDSKGNKLAYSKRDSAAGSFERIYPYGKMFAHSVGYDDVKLGSSGAESMFNSYLSGSENFGRRLGAIQHFLSQSRGDDVRLTLNAELQKIAYEALGNRKGAVVALDPKTGAILAMVSKPSFDPNNVKAEWQNLQKDTSGILLNRTIQGLYAPGSTLKPMVADAALKEGKITPSASIDCPGYLKIGDYRMGESHDAVHGAVDLKKALTVSCNTYFGTMALKLGSSHMADTFERYGFNKKLPNSDIEDTASRMPDFGTLSDGDLAQLGIGQGSLLVTPLRMAMLASVFGNHGVIMQPHILSEIRLPGGGIIKKYSPAKWLEVTTAENARIISEAMQNVVDNGTGRGAQISGIHVAGKTGSAENAQGETHAWFIGFAPVENPRIVIAVIVENGGGGGENAAPIARRVINGALSEEGNK